MKLPKDDSKEILRALKFHTDLLTFVLSRQTAIEARINASVALNQKILERLGVPIKDSNETVKKAYTSSCEKIQKTVESTVAKIQKTLPPSDDMPGFEKN